MTIEEIRLIHINYLADKWGRNTLAEKLGYDGVNYLNGLCSGHTNLGSNAARKIEKKLNLPVGELDEMRPYLLTNQGAKITAELLREMDSLSDEQFAIVQATISAFHKT